MNNAHTANALITKTFDASTGPMALTFREDGWFNMTKAAKAFGKDLSHFHRSPETLEYLEGLSAEFADKAFIDIKRGNGALPGVGTWAHPDLAVFFARWLSVKFSFWCDRIIKDILKGNAELIITKPEQSAVMALTEAQVASLDGLPALMAELKAFMAKPPAIQRAIGYPVGAGKPVVPVANGLSFYKPEALFTIKEFLMVAQIQPTVEASRTFGLHAWSYCLLGNHDATKGRPGKPAKYPKRALEHVAKKLQMI